MEGQQLKYGGEFAEWWAAVSEAELGATLPKVAEYGSADLEVMGAAMQEILPPLKPGVYWAGVEGASDSKRRLGLEAAIGFYLLGKIARLVGAMKQGEFASDDTLLDIAVYVKMLQRVREKGSWPGIQEED